MKNFIFLIICLFISGCGRSDRRDDFKFDQKRKNLVSKYEISLATWQRLKADHNGNYDLSISVFSSSSFWQGGS